MSSVQVLPPVLQIADLVFAKIKTHSLGVFAGFRVADLLASGPRSVEALAGATGAHARSLGRSAPAARRARRRRGVGRRPLSG